MKARNYLGYSYDDGTLTGNDLLTQSTDWAWYEGGLTDKRTTATSYSGQNNLGVTLRKQRSVTIDPGGLNLTRTTSMTKPRAASWRPVRQRVRQQIRFQRLEHVWEPR